MIHVKSVTPSNLYSHGIVSRHPDEYPSVGVVIPVKDPNLEYLDLTLGSIEAQRVPVNEVIIVNCLDDGLSVESSIPVEIIHSNKCDLRIQRRMGVQYSESSYILHLDEDSILLNTDHIHEALGMLEDEKIVGVGGKIRPIRDNLLGHIGAIATPWDAHFVMHHRDVCPDGYECFPGTASGEFHNEDVTLRKRLESLGRVEQLNDSIVLTDLPTKKQGAGMAIGSGVGVTVLNEILSGRRG